MVEIMNSFLHKPFPYFDFDFFFQRKCTLSFKGIDNRVTSMALNKEIKRKFDEFHRRYDTIYKK